MRIISGDLKGRTIKTVTNQLTRPTSDKVKESLFNIIGPYFSGGTALDLFAGSGGLGLEALSRGMNHVVFVDKQRQAIKMVKDNLTSLKLSNRAEVYQNDAFRALRALGKRQLQFNYIFLDPPYHQDLFEQIIEEVSNQNLSKEGALIICEHDRTQNLPPHVANFNKIRTETYGSSIVISLYQRKEDFHE